MTRRADYGLDAPPVVRNLLIAGVAGMLVGSTAALGLWSGVLQFAVGGSDVRVGLAPAGLGVGIGCLAMACWMIWSSRVGKVRERERLLDTLTWRGDEQVLDLGCGRGLMLIGAAWRLRTGRAIGVDLWRTADLGGNSPAAARANAEAEGVADKVTFETADMRALPLPSASVDVVLSRAAVHNINEASGRRQALEEVARVIRPGGTVLLADIRHLDEYAGVLRERGLAVTIEGSAIVRGLLTVITFGALRPGVVRGRRPASWLVAMLLPMVGAGTVAAQITCVPVAERAGSTPGCFITAREELGQLPRDSALYWHITTYPTLDDASAAAAKAPRSTAVTSLGQHWLFTIATAQWRPRGGRRIARIGPLPLIDAQEFAAVYMEGVFQPGMQSVVHRHAGVEAWYTLDGAQCLETPEGRQVQRAGEPGMMVRGGLPMRLTGIGTGIRRSLVLILQDATEPRSTPADDWTPKGLCQS